MSEVQESALPESQASQDAAISATAAAARPSLGLLLRKAREARGLSVEDVVQTLKFSHRQIEALETDDLASLPGSVFVRGSVRSYARFLKLDPEPLLALLAEEAPVVRPDVRPPDNMGDAMTDGGPSRVSPLVALSVVFLLAAVGIVAWHLLGGPSLEQWSASAMRGAGNRADEGQVAKQTEKEAQQQADAAPPAVAKPSEAVDPAVVPAMPAQTQPQSAQPQAHPDARTLEFDFRGRCWVEVKDASQQIIFTGQFEQGARESVSGRPPFQVVLGSAAAVDLRYEGQPVDLKPHTRAEVARLTLE